MQDNLITWSIKNWVTVFLMFLLGWAAISFAARLLKGRMGGTATESIGGQFAQAMGS